MLKQKYECLIYFMFVGKYDHFYYIEKNLTFILNYIAKSKCNIFSQKIKKYVTLFIKNNILILYLTIT